jgi:hypothetical protein
MPRLDDWHWLIQAIGGTMASMFAPYCPTCGHRVLLGTRRMIAANIDARPMRVTLRCFCGTAVRHDAVPPPAHRRPDRLAG